MSTIESGVETELSSWDIARNLENEFARNPDLQTANLLFLLSLSTRLSTERFQTSSGLVPRIQGVKADHLALHLGVEIAESGVNQPSSVIDTSEEIPCKRVFEFLLEQSRQSEHQFLEDMRTVNKQQEKVLLEGRGATNPDNTDELMQAYGEVKAWSLFVRITGDREFRFLLSPFIKRNEPLPEGIVNDELYFEYTDPLYWISVLPDQKNLLLWIAKEHARIAEKLGKTPYLSDPDEFYGSLEEEVLEGSRAFERGLLMSINSLRKTR